MSSGAANGQVSCPRCGKLHVVIARFCGACGHDLKGAGNQAGRVPHPKPLPLPQGFRRCEATPDLYYRWESAWGGASLIGTESLVVLLFSAGFALANVEINVTGLDPAGRVVFSRCLCAERMPRGEIVRIEVPSYEITQPWSDVRVELASAAYAVNE